MCHISCYVLAWTILGKLVAVMEVCVQGVPVGFVESLHMVVHGRCQISVGCYQMYLQNIKRSLSSVLAIYVNIHLLVFVKSVQHITILHIFYCAFLLKYFSVNHNFLRIPHCMKIFTEFNLAIWPRLVKFTELNIGEFWFLNSSYISYHWDILKNQMLSGIWI